MKHYLSLAITMLAASGCYSYRLAKPDHEPIAALAAPPPGVGQVCVLRPHWIGSAVTFVVRDNGVLVGATRGPSYFCYYAEPGMHTIATESDAKEEAVLEVEPGGNYYLHQLVDNIVGFVKSRSVWITPSEAAPLVEKCGYRVLVGVPGKERLPTIPATAEAAKTATAATR